MRTLNNILLRYFESKIVAYTYLPTYLPTESNLFLMLCVSKFAARFINFNLN